MNTPVSCSKGQKGKFKASELEFEIVDITTTTSTIRYRGETETHEIKDTDLIENAIGIAQFTKKKE